MRVEFLKFTNVNVGTPLAGIGRARRQARMIDGRGMRVASRVDQRVSNWVGAPEKTAL